MAFPPCGVDHVVWITWSASAFTRAEPWPFNSGGGTTYIPDTRGRALAARFSKKELFYIAPIAVRHVFMFSDFTLGNTFCIFERTWESMRHDSKLLI
jgi:hypothetical protein